MFGEMNFPVLMPDIVRIDCKKAHTDGYLVAAHVESPEGVRVALENGVDSIEHGAHILELLRDVERKSGGQEDV